MLEDTIYMQRCIELATNGAGLVSPNPLVGCVIVYKEKIIGEGFHQRYGQAHAEVNAIQDALHKFADTEVLFKECTLYVTLEPCAHFGKTPPCTHLIIKYGFKKVVIGSTDPFEQVNGKGINQLRAAGIAVEHGIMKNECDFLNRRFFTRVNKQRPYIILKWAQTTDHYFAPDDGSQKWITSAEAKILTHQWRAEEDAVLVGKNTALIDNPQLTVRETKGRNPIRIVIDRNLELPTFLYLFDYSQETLVFNARETYTDGKIKYLELEDFDALLPQLICYQLYLMDVQSIIIEGGAKTLELFIKAGLWDEARIFTSPDKWGKGIKSPQIEGKILDKQQVGPDTLEILLPHY